MLPCPGFGKPARYFLPDRRYQIHHYSRSSSSLPSPFEGYAACFQEIVDKIAWIRSHALSHWLTSRSTCITSFLRLQPSRADFPVESVQSNSDPPQLSCTRAQPTTTDEYPAYHAIVVPQSRLRRRNNNQERPEPILGRLDANDCKQYTLVKTTQNVLPRIWQVQEQKWPSVFHSPSSYEEYPHFRWHSLKLRLHIDKRRF